MTLAELQQEIATKLPDNEQGLITPQKLREVLLMIVQGMAEGVDQ